MNVQEDLKKYKNTYRLYTSFLEILKEDNCNIIIDCDKINDNDDKINFLIYKSDYIYLTQDELNEMFCNDELQFINFEVTMNRILASKLVNLIRFDFTCSHEMLLPFFDKDNNQVLPSKTDTLTIKINNQEQLKDAHEVHYSLIRKKKRN